MDYITLYIYAAFFFYESKQRNIHV